MRYMIESANGTAHAVDQSHRGIRKSHTSQRRAQHHGFASVTVTAIMKCATQIRRQQFHGGNRLSVAIKASLLAHIGFHGMGEGIDASICRSARRQAQG